MAAIEKMPIGFHGPVLVTGGAGFIGSNFVLEWLSAVGTTVVNFDTLTYAGNRSNLSACHSDPRHIFVQGDIRDHRLLRQAFAHYEPAAVVHFAAESHVDRSIHAPEDFITTNINGTFALLEAARSYWQELSSGQRDTFRFLHVSTDEVYGSLSPDAPTFTEEHPYEPNSPYSASKAASDHLVRAYNRTYDLPTLTTNCSNNYGPFQFPEKLIPLMILNAVRGKALPVYGDGQNVRDWLYVKDHCEAIRIILRHGRTGETYNIGGGNEMKNIDVVRTICDIIDELRPADYKRQSLIASVVDRPGHDRRYAINASKIKRELGWSPREDFQVGIRKTVQWYLENSEWVEQVISGGYRTQARTHPA